MHSLLDVFHLHLCADNRVLIAREGGLALVVDALKRHKNNAEVIRRALGALKNLSCSDGACVTPVAYTLHSETGPAFIQTTVKPSRASGEAWLLW